MFVCAKIPKSVVGCTFFLLFIKSCNSENCIKILIYQYLHEKYLPENRIFSFLQVKARKKAKEEALKL